MSFFLAACSNTAVRNGVTDSALSGPNLRIAAVGDIMLGTDFPKDNLPPDDLVLLQPIADTLRKADITFGNLEGSLLDGGEPVKTCSNPNHCYLFRTPTRFAIQLKEAGFDVLGLANNHARDFGEEGRTSSMETLAAIGLAHTGREGDIAVVSVKGRTIAVVAYAPFAGANDMLDLDAARQQIEALQQLYDTVVVSMHGGAEGWEKAHIPFAEETYYGENRGDVVAFAHMAVDAGADLVIGHGPHVPRAIELYNERLIAYSLGNFATHWGINIRDKNGVAPILLVEIDAKGRFVKGKIESAKQQRMLGTIPDESHEAARTIAELTHEDFPHTTLHIDQRGNIQRLKPSILSGSSPDAERVSPSLAKVE